MLLVKKTDVITSSNPVGMVSKRAGMGGGCPRESPSNDAPHLNIKHYSVAELRSLLPQETQNQGGMIPTFGCTFEPSPPPLHYAL